MGNASAPSKIELIDVSITPDWRIDAQVSFWIVVALLAAVVIFYLINRLGGRTLLSRGFEIDSAELGAGDSKLTFKPNMNDKAVAYKIWVELSTRKIGLPIDLKDDVIAEIYDSWYSFFTVTRELIKDIPVSKVRSKSTRQIILLSINVLNLGLRPHLTAWQARFRKWYDYKISTDLEAKYHPQDVQKEFPDYDKLVNDLLNVNQKLIKYRDKMNDLVHS